MKVISTCLKDDRLYMMFDTFFTEINISLVSYTPRNNPHANAHNTPQHTPLNNPTLLELDTEKYYYKYSKPKNELVLMVADKTEWVVVTVNSCKSFMIMNEFTTETKELGFGMFAGLLKLINGNSHQSDPIEQHGKILTQLKNENICAHIRTRDT